MMNQAHAYAVGIELEGEYEFTLISLPERGLHYMRPPLVLQLRDRPRLQCDGTGGEHIPFVELVLKHVTDCQAQNGAGINRRVVSTPVIE